MLFATWKKNRNKTSNTKKMTMPKKKKLDGREVQESTIYASLAYMDENDNIKQVRSKRTPVIVKVDWNAYELKTAVFEKFQRYHHKTFEGKIKHDFKLVYKNGDVIKKIPGTDIDFTIKRYKEDLGVGYTAIIVYLLPYDINLDSSSGDSDEDKN